MHSLQIRDRVLLNDGREVIVEQIAAEDSIFQYSEGQYAGWTDISLVAWNYTQTEFATLDSELQQDYT